MPKPRMPVNPCKAENRSQYELLRIRKLIWDLEESIAQDPGFSRNYMLRWIVEVLKSTEYEMIHGPRTSD